MKPEMISADTASTRGRKKGCVVQPRIKCIVRHNGQKFMFKFEPDGTLVEFMRWGTKDGGRRLDWLRCWHREAHLKRERKRDPGKYLLRHGSAAYRAFLYIGITDPIAFVAGKHIVIRRIA